MTKAGIPAGAAIAYRQGTGSDLEGICGLDRMAGLDGWPFEALLATLSQAGGILWVAIADDIPVGHALGRTVADECEILRLSVDPRRRRSGIAAALLDLLLKTAHEAGAHTCHLEVRAGNDAALALYRGRGFQVRGRRSGYYRNPTEDAILLALGVQAWAKRSIGNTS